MQRKPDRHGQMHQPTGSSGVPTDPEAFAETDHFEEAIRDDMRYLTRDMARKTIAEGREYPDQGGPGKIRRKREYDGVDAVVVLAKDTPVLVTGWTEVRKWSKALASERWSYDDLETIRAFVDREHKRL